MTDKPVFPYKFVHPGISQVEVTVLAYMANTTIPESKAKDIVKNGSSNSPPGVKSGVFRSTLESRVPMNKVNISGNTWLNHGQLLDLSLTCDGTGPWTYCWSVRDKDYNITGNETCSSPEILLDECSFPIMWYFRTDGIFNVLLVVSNGLTVHRQIIHVNIYEVYPQVPVSFVLVPVFSTIVVVAFIIFGVYTFIRYQRNLAVEIADFDFNYREETLEYMTFWERLKESMVNAISSSSSGDTVSHVSSVSSRSGTGGHHLHHPNIGVGGGSIHYGSIT